MHPLSPSSIRRCCVTICVATAKNAQRNGYGRRARGAHNSLISQKMHAKWIRERAAEKNARNEWNQEHSQCGVAVVSRVLKVKRKERMKNRCCAYINYPNMCSNNSWMHQFPVLLRATVIYGVRVCIGLPTTQHYTSAECWHGTASHVLHDFVRARVNHKKFASRRTTSRQSCRKCDWNCGARCAANVRVTHLL